MPSFVAMVVFVLLSLSQSVEKSIGEFWPYNQFTFSGIISLQDILNSTEMYVEKKVICYTLFHLSCFMTNLFSYLNLTPCVIRIQMTVCSNSWDVFSFSVQLFFIEFVLHAEELDMRKNFDSPLSGRCFHAGSPLQALWCLLAEWQQELLTYFLWVRSFSFSCKLRKCHISDVMEANVKLLQL